MAKVVGKKYIPKHRRRGRKNSYPWTEWFDGQRRRIVKGEDFQCDVGSMGDSIRKRAKDRRVKLLEVSEEATAVVFQAAKPRKNARKLPHTKGMRKL